MKTPAIAFSNVHFARGDRLVLERITFAVQPGEFIGIIGGNGAGKSTLLRLALGLLRPASGEIAIFGGDVRGARGMLAYVPQRIDLEPGLPLRARDFVALGNDGAAFGFALPSAGRRRRVDEALAAVGATAFADKPIGLLSGGEQQRLAIAQAIAGHPKVLLLDEALANLDLRSAAEIVALVARLGQEFAMTVMLVAHDINPLLASIDRVLYLANGRAAIGPVASIVNEDTLSRLYDRPVDVLHVRGRVIVVAGDAQSPPRDGDAR